MKNQVPHTVLCYISGDAVGEILILITLGSERAGGTKVRVRC